MITIRNTKRNSYTFNLSKKRTLFVPGKAFVQVENDIVKEKEIDAAIRKGLLSTVLPRKAAPKAVPTSSEAVKIKEPVKEIKKEYDKKNKGGK